MIDRFFGEYRFLSNFWPVVVEYEGIRYPSTEHAFQAAKTVDQDERRRIAVLPSPRDAKRAGRTVSIRDDWDEIRIDVMLDLVRRKFRHAYLREMLLATGDHELVEGNDWNDFYWGVCRGRGENNLGKILMRVRDEIQDKMHSAREDDHGTA
jgi:hypothetical protein